MAQKSGLCPKLWDGSGFWLQIILHADIHLLKATEWRKNQV